MPNFALNWRDKIITLGWGREMGKDLRPSFGYFSLARIFFLFCFEVCEYFGCYLNYWLRWSVCAWALPICFVNIYIYMVFSSKRIHYLMIVQSILDILVQSSTLHVSSHKFMQHSLCSSHHCYTCLCSFLMYISIHVVN